MWQVENRKRYERKTKRYPSDMMDEEWALVEPHLPPPTKGRTRNWGQPPFIS